MSTKNEEPTQDWYKMLLHQWYADVFSSWAIYRITLQIVYHEL